MSIVIKKEKRNRYSILNTLDPVPSIDIQVFYKAGITENFAGTERHESTL
jgi:hypothetical protein